MEIDSYGQIEDIKYSPEITTLEGRDKRKASMSPQAQNVAKNRRMSELDDSSNAK